MRSDRPFVTFACVLSAMFLSAGSASALTTTYFVVGGGLDDGHACLSSTGAGACSSSATFGFGPSDSFAASGTITFNDSTNTMGFDITVATASMSGGHDGVDEVLFTSVNYSTSGVTAFNLGGGNLQAFGTLAADVSGSYEQRNGGATVVGSSSFSQSASLSAFGCLVPGGVGQCGLTIGASGDRLALNVGTTGLGDPTDFVHTLNLNVVVPEPASASMLALGLVALGIAKRRS